MLTIVVGSLFNSLLIDHIESLFFAWMSGLLFAAVRAAGQMTIMSLSVIVITKNEEAAIRRCLEVGGLGGRNRRGRFRQHGPHVGVCEELGAKVHSTADWPGFGAQKNRALDLATWRLGTLAGCR